MRQSGILLRPFDSWVPANIAALFVLVFSAVCGRGQQALQITFEGPPTLQPGTGIYLQQYYDYESSMWFRPLGRVGPGNGFDLQKAGSQIPFFPDNGTAYLAAALGDSLVFSFTDESAFNLLSVDLAEYSTVVPDAVTVHFVGYRQDGGMIAEDFTTDGSIDGTGPLPDFQTFYFGPEWSGLRRVEIPDYGWSLDNLVVSVPEPSPAVFISVAAAGFVLRRIKRKKLHL